jgi:heat-inducible transcriptional repressor
LRDRIAEAIVGHDLEHAVLQAQRLAEELPLWAKPDEMELASQVVETVRTQLQANRTERISIAGAANLSRSSDDFASNLGVVLEAIEEQVTLLRLFGELSRDEREVVASIGRENQPYGLEHTAVIASSYEHDGDARAGLGILGPIRMDYANNIATVRAVASYLSRMLGEA